MSNRELGNEPETIIAPSVKVEGDLVSQGNVLIEGIVEGSLRTERDLRVGERARISADVSATNATVAGEVRGNIVIAEKLELEPTARIFGDVKTKIFIVSNGAMVNGKIVMGDGSSDERPVKAAKSESSSERQKVVAEKVAEKDHVDEKEKARTINAFFTR